MWHLALETIGLSGSVALFKHTQCIANSPLPSQIGSARSLLPAIDQVVREASLTPASLELLSLARGPGSFTGIRVSVATAKALGYALQIPLCAVDTLETLAYRLACAYCCDAARSGEPFRPTFISVAIDAYRKQVFRLVALVESPPSRQFEDSSHVEMKVVIPSHHLDVADWKANPFHGLDHGETATTSAERVSRSSSFLADCHRYTWIVGGNAVERYSLAAGIRQSLTIVDPADISAWDVGRYAYRQWLAGVRTDPFQLLPNYLRASAAEEKANTISDIPHTI